MCIQAADMDFPGFQSLEVDEIVHVDDVDDQELVEFVFQFEKDVEGVKIYVSEDESDSCVDKPAPSMEYPDSVPASDTDNSAQSGPSMQQVREFCAEQEKKNTKKATERDIKNFSEWLACVKFEMRSIETIPPKELNEYMAQYFVYVRKDDGSEYQPGTLTNMFHSFSRFLNSCKYFSDDLRISILKHDLFEDARMALSCKRKELKKQGLGNRPNRSVPVEDEEEAILWEKGILGVSSPFSLQFSLWFHLTLLMGLRGRDEHRALCFGDLKIKKDAQGLEYVEMLERASKTRDGSAMNDTRATSQKVFCSCTSVGPERCVIEMLKTFIIHRPSDFCKDDDPFYLQLKHEDHIKKSDTDVWYKQQPLGANSLGKLLPKACELAGLAPRGNHGVRATTVQRLRNASVPDDKIIQITGHKSIRTLAIYDTDKLSSSLHQHCQSVLQGSSKSPSESSASATTSISSSSVVPVSSNDALSYPSQVSSVVANDTQNLGVQSMFEAAVFNNCIFNFGSVHKDRASSEQ